MQTLAQQAYGNVQSRTASDKEIEQALMAQITAELEELAAQEKPDRAKWYAAVSRNLKMWTIFASDLSNENNGLPDDLKSQILYLADFVSQQSRALFAKSEGELTDLISINNILLGKGGSQLTEVT